MIITDTLRGNRKIVENVIIVPRKGEKLVWDYSPVPKVKNVMYDFNTNQIFVEIE